MVHTLYESRNYGTAALGAADTPTTSGGVVKNGSRALKHQGSVSKSFYFQQNQESNDKTKAPNGGCSERGSRTKAEISTMEHNYYKAVVSRVRQ